MNATPTVRTFLLILALVLFLLAGANIGHPRLNLIGLGLACVTAAAFFTV